MAHWRIHGSDVLEGHQFNSIVQQARQAGHEVTFDDDKNTIDINGISQEEIEAGTQWLEDRTGHHTHTKRR